MRSGSSARLKAVATSKMHEAKVNAENGQLTSEALTQSANTSDESLGTEEASQTHIASVEDEEVSTEEQKQATLSEEQLLKTETQPQIASANIQDKRLSKDMLAPALTASVEDEEVSTEDQTQATFSEEELLKTEKHSQIRTTNEKQLSITGQTGTDVESQIANACRQSLVTEAHTAYSEGEQLSITTARLVENGRPSTETKQQTTTVHVQDELLQTKSKTESRNLDVGWLVDEVKGLATEDTAEVDWLVQEVKRLAKETLATAHSGDSLSEASRDALDETDAAVDAGLVRGPDSDEEDVLNAAKSGEKKTRTNDGDITTGKVDLHIGPKSMPAPNHKSGVNFISCSAHHFASQTSFCHTQTQSPSAPPFKTQKHHAFVRPCEAAAASGRGRHVYADVGPALARHCGSHTTRGEQAPRDDTNPT